MSISDTVRLGLAPKQVDPRTLRYAAVRADAPWIVPSSYSWDGENPGAVTTPMYANDRLGDCVIAARAHQTLRFEYVEQHAAPPITDGDVEREYLEETGGADDGLVMLYSLRDWRKGWHAGGQSLRIHSFYEVMPQNHDEVKEAMLVGTGVQFGVRLPLSAADQLDAGQPWDLASGPRSAAGSWGGHAVLAVAYDAAGVEFITWGKRQRATWRWCDAYADECFLVIDDVDRLDGFARPGLLSAALATI